MSVDHPLAGLKPIRHYRGLSLAEAAEVIGVNASSYARYEAGTRRIYLDRAKALADILGCTIDDLTVYRSADELFHYLKPWNRPPAGQLLPPVPPPPAAGSDTVVGALADWDTDGATS